MGVAPRRTSYRNKGVMVVGAVLARPGSTDAIAFQCETALGEMERYVELRPEDAFGHEFAAFLHRRLGHPEGNASTRLPSRAQ